MNNSRREHGGSCNEHAAPDQDLVGRALAIIAREGKLIVGSVTTSAGCRIDSESRRHHGLHDWNL